MLLTAFTAGAGLCAEPIGSVIAVKGKCSAVGSDNKSRTLELKSPVFLNDRIVTGERSSIQIMLDDESMISQGEKSEMVIDKYLYSPEKKKANCSLRAVKGLFRIITGKITSMNPERFKVRTKMATVGIRGCELGLELMAKREDFYVLFLPEGHSMIFQQFGEAAAMTSGRTLVVPDHGILVSLQAEAGFTSRDMTASEALDLLSRSVSGEPSGSGKSDPGRGKDKKDDSGNDEVLEVTEKVNEGSDDKSQDELEEELLSQLVEPPPHERGSSPDSAPSTSTPTTEPPVLVGGHPTMDDWEWGLWEDGTTFYSGNRSLGASFLSQTEYDAIATGASTYNLTGSGMAGAVVYHAASGETKDMNGLCSLDVTVGNTASPTWGGTFSLSNTDGDALDFQVPNDASGGTIGADGHLGLNGFSTYDLTVNGDHFAIGSITSTTMDGRLIKPGGGMPPISAVGGEIHVEHGTAARGDSVFGSNLSVP